MEQVIPEISLEVLQRIAPNASLVQGNDREVLTAQLGRDPRGLVGIGARCACGDPAVTITYPRLPDGSPFPTLFYLSLPALIKEISRIESAGGMVQMNERLLEDETLRAGHLLAHKKYVEKRELLAKVPEIIDKSAGGLPDRVKCLHALAGYALAAGKGVCPLGDEALSLAGWDIDICRCVK